MNIGLMHFRVHETDGVSLEMAKWKTVLEQNGHTVVYIAQEERDDTYGIPELDIQAERHERQVCNAYGRFEDYPDEAAFINEIETDAASIGEKLESVVESARLDLLIINNISSLGMHLPAGLAVSRLRKSDLRIAFHHHDFYWERERYRHPTLDYVNKLLEKVFPPVDMDADHFVINRIAQEALEKHKGLNSVVVPNVFDFNQPRWTVDAFNQDLRERLGIRAHDIMMLQATRIVKRKAIEFAVDVASELERRIVGLEGERLYSGHTIDASSKVHLVVAGMNEMDGAHYQKLLDHIKRKGVHAHFINPMIATRRKPSPHKKYSLWDVYPHADAVTYPSVLEGWGNQFIEAVFAKKPVVCFRYPVFETDIAPLGFKIVSLGDTHEVREDGLYTLDKKVVKEATEGLLTRLLDRERYFSEVNHNYAVAEKELSYAKLEAMLNANLAPCFRSQQ